MKELQYKSISQGIVKNVDPKNGIVTGYASTFGVLDSDGDIMMPGCYSKTIQEWGPNGKNRIKHLLQHDRWQPLATPSMLVEDGKGLYFESKIAPTSYGKDTLILYAEGVLNEHSVGFQTIKANESIQDGKSVMQITEVKLWEFSSVTFGANANTPFTGFKGEATKEEIENHIERINKGLRLAGLTDETYQSLEYSLLQLKSMFPLNAKEPNTHSEAKPEDLLKQLNEYSLLLKLEQVK